MCLTTIRTKGGIELFEIGDNLIANSRWNLCVIDDTLDKRVVMASQLGFVRVTWSCSRGSTRDAENCCVMSRREAGLLGVAAITSATLSLFPIDARAAEHSAHQKPSIGKRLFAESMERGMVAYETNISTVKKHLFSQICAVDVVVDIGFGTGPNLRYLPAGAQMLGIEPNEYMWAYAAQRARQYGIDLELRSGVCEALPLADECCDVVITTLTLCSVDDVQAALREIVRVLRPGGRHMFIEHVAAGRSRKLLRVMQEGLTPLQIVFADGCHLNRETGGLIREMVGKGYSEVRCDEFDLHFGGVGDWLNPLRPHIAGVARKAPR